MVFQGQNGSAKLFATLPIGLDFARERIANITLCLIALKVR